MLGGLRPALHACCTFQLRLNTPARHSRLDTVELRAGTPRSRRVFATSDLDRLEQRYDVLRGYHERDVRLLPGRVVVDVTLVIGIRPVIPKGDLNQL